MHKTKIPEELLYKRSLAPLQSRISFQLKIYRFFFKFLKLDFFSLA